MLHLLFSSGLSLSASPYQTTPKHNRGRQTRHNPNRVVTRSSLNTRLPPKLLIGNPLRLVCVLIQPVQLLFHTPQWAFRLRPFDTRLRRLVALIVRHSSPPLCSGNSQWVARYPN